MTSYRASNKRIIPRSGNGRFRKATFSDVGIGGECPVCHHLLLRHYDGDPRQRPADPRRFRYRCFTCDPRTEAELALEKEIEESRPKQVGMIAMFESAMRSLEEREDD